MKQKFYAIEAVLLEVEADVDPETHKMDEHGVRAETPLMTIFVGDLGTMPHATTCLKHVQRILRDYHKTAKAMQTRARESETAKIP